MHCDFHDMPREACPHSVDKAVLAAFDNQRVVHKGLVADGPTIDATQDTPCPGCDGRITPGERITHTEHGWAHATEVEPKAPDDVDWSGFA